MQALWCAYTFVRLVYLNSEKHGHFQFSCIALLFVGQKLYDAILLFMYETKIQSIFNSFKVQHGTK